MRRPASSELGRQHDVVAARPENAAQRLLRTAAVAVAIGGVDHVDAEVEGLVHDGARRSEIDAAAEIIAAQPDDGDMEIGVAELAGLHRADLL